MSLLEIRDLSLAFGGVRALDRVSLTVAAGEVLAIIGPNGAGKSTLFNVVSRFQDPDAGDVRFDGRSLLRRRASAIAGLGIARSFQNIELFEHQTVLDNLLVARHAHCRVSLPAQLLFTPAVRREETGHRRRVEEVIEFLDLQPFRDRPIAGLPYGTRKLVEIGRALAVGPRLLLLDEPAAGLSAEEARDIRFRVEELRDRMGITVLLVEHDMRLVAAVADRVLVLAAGRVVTLGPPAEVLCHPAVIEAYLGQGEAG